jgi:hypothetical protein
MEDTMKQYTIFAIVVVNLVILVLALNALLVRAAVLSAPPVNPPVPPVDAPSTLRRLPSAGVESVGQTQPAGPTIDQALQVGPRPLTLQEAEALRQADVHFPTVNLGEAGNSVAAPQGQTCRTMILDPQMDVTEFAGGITATIEYWETPWWIIYFDKRPGYYHSPSYSLAMADELDGSDEDVISSTLDYDQFGQSFLAPNALTVITVTYSRMYTNTDPADYVYGNLWALDAQKKLTDHYYWWSVPESPGGWVNWRLVITDTSVLADISGKPWALVFEMYSNRQAPGEIVWLDDAQVTACYATGPVSVYLPIVMKQPPPPESQSVCAPYEPDSATQRGSTVVGATCHGSFDSFDTKDYYDVYPKGVTQVRLWLRNLPTGSNWNATLWEDANGSYINPCNIGTKGDQDKSVDCTLDLAKKYFVVIGAPTAPGASGNTYDMIVESRAAPTPTPTSQPGPTPTPTPTSQPGPTPGFWSSTTGDEFYVSTNRANVLNFAIYLINVGSCSSVKITHTKAEPISSNAFSFTGAFYASGTFDSATTAHGTDGLDHFSLPPCGVTVSGGPWNWTATWKNSTQPTVVNVVPTGPITVELLDSTSGSHTATEVK